MKIINYKNLAKPSNILRNFAIKSATWRDCHYLSTKIDASHDFRFETDYQNVYSEIAARVFYSTAGRCLFGIYKYATNQVAAFVGLAKNSPESPNNYIVFQLKPASGIVDVVRHKVRIDIIGNVVRGYLDDTLITTINDIYRITPVDLLPPVSAAGNIYNISITDLNSSNKIWTYPSISERLRLVTYTNVRTDRNCFEAADSALGWSIKTALPAGIAGTVLAKINGVVVANPTNWNRTTATFTGLATDKLEWLSVFTETLSENKIMYLNLK